MRLASLAVDGGFHPALVLGEEALDLVSARAINAAARLLPADMLAIFEGGGAAMRLLSEITAAASTNAAAYRSCGALKPLGAVKLAAPIPRPRVVMAVGANYHEHLKEMNSPPPATPLSWPPPAPTWCCVPPSPPACPRSAPRSTA